MTKQVPRLKVEKKKEKMKIKGMDENENSLIVFA